MIDKDGNTLDFLLADRRDAKAAKRFLAKTLRCSRDWKPQVINTDGEVRASEVCALEVRRAEVRILEFHTAFAVLRPPVVPGSNPLSYSSEILVVCHIGAPAYLRAR